MDELTPYGFATPTLTSKAERHMSTEWRHYFMTPDPLDVNNQYITAWVALTAGEFYKVEGYAVEGTGKDHFTVSVEYEQAATTGHPKANKEIQELRIDQDNVEEKFDIIIENPVGGYFVIQFVNPKYDGTATWSQFWRSEYILDTVSEW